MKLCLLAHVLWGGEGAKLGNGIVSGDLDVFLAFADTMFRIVQ
jgi:hypothetical protein